MSGIFSAEKLKYALRVPLNGVSGSKKTFKGTLGASLYKCHLRVETTKFPKIIDRPCVTLFSFTKIFDLGKFQDF